MNARRLAAPVLATALCAIAFAMARPSKVSDSERRRMAEPFRFHATALPRLPGFSAAAYARRARPVHRGFERLQGWISSVGAAVAAADLDGDGLSNDVVLTDPRIDRVVVQMAPGTEKARASYSPFALETSLCDHRTMAPMGAVCGDLNEDGAMDVAVYYWGRSPVAFIRDPKRTLGPAAFHAVPLGPEGERWFTNAATLGDVDGDGHLDLVVGNYFPDGSAVLDPADRRPQAMCDAMSQAHNGGRNRFLLGLGADAPTERFLFREAEPLDEHGVPLERSLLTGWTLATGLCDLGGDGLPEVFFGNDFGEDRLFANVSKPGSVCLRLLHGTKGFTTPNSRVLGNDSYKGMGVDFADLNGDGRPDFLVSNITVPYALMESQFAFVSEPGKPAYEGATAHYTDRAEELGTARDGWGWDVRACDFDNDGIPEIVRAVNFVRGDAPGRETTPWHGDYQNLVPALNGVPSSRWPELHERAMGNDDFQRNPAFWPDVRGNDEISGRDPMPFYVRGPDGRYVDLGTAVGLGVAPVGRGLAVADVDGDGRTDLLVASQWGGSYLLHNDSPERNAFLGVRVRQALRSSRSAASLDDPATPSRPAIGAEVVVYVGARTVRSQIDGGSGHSGKRSPELIFGLGPNHPGPVDFEVFWRKDGRRVGSGRLRANPGWHTVTLGGATGGAQ